MKTKLVHILSLELSNIEEVLVEPAKDIREGLLVAFPTETVYGLGANALDESAVNRIFKAKERPKEDPLIVHVCNIDDIKPLVSENISEETTTLLNQFSRFWPGPFTAVLPKSNIIPSVVTSGKDNLAIRIPSHPIAQTLIKLSKVPIAAPSANLFTRPSPTSAKHVLEDLDGKIDWIINGGDTWFGVESTIIDINSNPPKILRLGAIPVERFQEICKDLIVTTNNFIENKKDKNELQEDGIKSHKEEVINAPGMYLKHYAPNVEMIVFAGDNPQNVLNEIRKYAIKELSNKKQVAILTTSKDAAFFSSINAKLKIIGEEGDFEGIAKKLFQSFRELEHMCVDTILVSGFPLIGIGRTLQDRLFRAAEGKVIWVSS